MRRMILASLSMSLMGFASVALGAKPAQIDVMTQNQYLGADLNPVVAAGSAVPFDPVAFNAAVLTALGQVAANLPEQRYLALAREISGRRPDVVGLQEAFDFICTPPGPDDPNGLVGNGCNFSPIVGAFNDHLQGTLDALHGAYVASAVVRNLNVTLPIVTPVGGAYVTVIDRDAILVRSGLAGASSIVPYGYSCSYPSMDGCNYDVVAETSIAGQPVRIERGFVGIDLDLGAARYRIVDTHLEVREPDPGNPFSRYFQSAQAYQLVNTVPVALDGRQLIVIGDFNSAPTDVPVGPIVPPYMQFAAAGFTDAWTMRPGAATGKGAPLVGLSCCQLEDLSNLHSMLYERIDLVWSLRRPAKVLNARLIGETASSKTWPPGQGLWPSDHAAVAATLRY
jgi:endonuclease/exonuclease/phosphatase family metal-dependent hydrolase